MHRRQIILGFTGLLIAGPLATLAAMPTAGAASTKPTVTSVVAAAKKAIAAERGVHLEITTKAGSTTSYTTADLGSDTGTERVTDGKASVTIEMTRSFGYLSGNSLGLTSLIGMTDAQAKKTGKDWVSLAAGTSQYTGLKSSVTTAEVALALPAVKGTKLATNGSGSSKQYVLTWTIAATKTTPKTENTVVLNATGSTLPVEETAKTSDGSGTAKFSKWGEQISVTAPPSRSTISYDAVAG